MVINAVCPHCKRVYPVDEQYAGQTFTCETCGNPFTVPVPGVVQPAASVPAASAADEYPREISRNRRLSGRVCFVLSGLLYAGACFCGIVGTAFFAVPNAVPPGLAAGVFAVIFLGIGLFNAVVATLYLVCGIFIRKGGFVSAVIALVAASIHALIILIMMIAATAQAGRAGFHGGTVGQFAFVLSLYGIFLLALCQLIYFLIKVVREPRN